MTISYSLLENHQLFIRPKPGFRYCIAGYQLDARKVLRSQKCEPGCPGSHSARAVRD
jgi:hypothetical protein